MCDERPDWWTTTGAADPNTDTNPYTDQNPDPNTNPYSHRPTGTISIRFVDTLRRGTRGHAKYHHPVYMECRGLCNRVLPKGRSWRLYVGYRQLEFCD